MAQNGIGRGRRPRPSSSGYGAPARRHRHPGRPDLPRPRGDVGRRRRRGAATSTRAMESFADVAVAPHGRDRHRGRPGAGDGAGVRRRLRRGSRSDLIDLGDFLPQPRRRARRRRGRPRRRLRRARACGDASRCRPGDPAGDRPQRLPADRPARRARAYVDDGTAPRGLGRVRHGLPRAGRRRRGRRRRRRWASSTTRPQVAPGRRDRHQDRRPADRRARRPRSPSAETQVLAADRRPGRGPRGGAAGLPRRGWRGPGPGRLELRRHRADRRDHEHPGLGGLPGAVRRAASARFLAQYTSPEGDTSDVGVRVLLSSQGEIESVSFVDVGERVRPAASSCQRRHAHAVRLRAGLGRLPARAVDAVDRGLRPASRSPSTRLRPGTRVRHGRHRRGCRRRRGPGVHVADGAIGAAGSPVDRGNRQFRFSDSTFPRRRRSPSSAPSSCPGPWRRSRRSWPSGCRAGRPCA